MIVRRGRGTPRNNGIRRRAGSLGAIDDYYASDCPAGTHEVNGGCFREPTTQQTPWGVVAVPDPGPETDLRAAEGAARAAGIDLTCQRQAVNTGGVYSYQQDVCSIPGYDQGFDAALIAQPGGINILKGDLAYARAQGDGSYAGDYFSSPTFGGGQPAATIPGTSAVGTYVPAPTAAPAASNILAASPSAGPAAGSAGSAAPAPSQPAAAKFDVSSVPGWVWAAVAGFAGLMLLKGEA